MVTFVKNTYNNMYNSFDKYINNDENTVEVDFGQEDISYNTKQ